VFRPYFTYIFYDSTEPKRGGPPQSKRATLREAQMSLDLCLMMVTRTSGGN